MYTDVQQLKMAQMVALPLLLFCRFDELFPDTFTVT